VRTRGFEKLILHSTLLSLVHSKALAQEMLL